MEVSAITQQPNSLMTEEMYFIMTWLFHGVILVVICCFGIVSNIINIVCFVRQGLRDPVNVSDLGLAISDLGSLVTGLCTGVCHGPALWTLDLPVEMMDVGYMVFAPPFLLFTGVTAWLTAFICLERCLCITMPVKVKSLITPKRVTVVIGCIFIFLTCTASTMYWFDKLSWVFSPERNRTVLKLADHTDHATIIEISYFVNGAFIPLSAYVTIVICTFTLVIKLRSKTKWRKMCTASFTADHTSKRDQRVAKMVMMISILFIACFTPVCLSIVLMIVVPELAINGPNQNLIYIMGAVCMVLQSGNSSANFFIYYKMSSRYRFVFRALFWCGTGNQLQRTEISRAKKSKAKLAVAERSHNAG